MVLRAVFVFFSEKKMPFSEGVLMSFLPDKMVVFALIFAVLSACPYEMVLEKKSVLWYNIYIYEH